MQNNKPKELIYFPSLSSFSPYLRKDIPLINDYSHRFYDKDKFGDWHHPYFLLSAGSVYKKKTIRKDLGMDEAGDVTRPNKKDKTNCLVFGDSGGYQIATGALKWDVKLREDIFNWLEDNSDVAMNIDVPPVSKDYPFKECIRITVDNMKWFEDNQTGKTDFLNVIQCQTIAQMEEWFAAVKGFKKFKGWGAGNVSCTMNFIHLLYMFKKHDMFATTDFNWFHFLGKTSPEHYMLYAVLQKKLNEHYPHIQVTTDSSTPAMQAVFGNWYHGVNYRSKTFAGLYFGNKGKTNYIPGTPLPCTIDCPMCKEITFTNVENDGGKARFYIAYHNLFLMNKALKDINVLSESHFEIFDGLVDGKFYKVLKSIIDIFDAKNNKELEKIYADIKPLLEEKQFSLGYDVSDQNVVDDSEMFGHVTIQDEEAVADRANASLKYKLSKKDEKMVKDIKAGIAVYPYDEQYYGIEENEN
ncbi:MAG: hypothetical protein ABIP51_12375 [Bacteroidia bacterium]